MIGHYQGFFLFQSSNNQSYNQIIYKIIIQMSEHETNKTSSRFEMQGYLFKLTMSVLVRRSA